MGRPCKFSEVQVQSIKYIILGNTTIDSDGHTRMLISDEEMASTLVAAGYNANPKYVERLRTELSILRRLQAGKFSEAEFAKIWAIFNRYIIPDRAHEKRLSVSDAKLSQVISVEGYPVNATYIERMRQHYGVNAFQQRSLMNARIKRHQEDDDHIQAVMELSIKRRPSANNYGASGTDGYTPGIGSHTLSYDEALEKKDKQVQRLQAKERRLLISKEEERRQALEFRLQHSDIIAEMKKVRGNKEELQEFLGSVTGDGCYKKGKGGSKRSAHNNQVYQSIT